MTAKPEDLRNYFACNLRENPKAWIRELVGVQAESTYAKWKAYQESLTYNLIQDVTKVEEAHPEGRPWRLCSYVKMVSIHFY